MSKTVNDKATKMMTAASDAYNKSTEDDRNKKAESMKLDPRKIQQLSANLEKTVLTMNAKQKAKGKVNARQLTGVNKRNTNTPLEDMLQIYEKFDEIFAVALNVLAKDEIDGIGVLYQTLYLQPLNKNIENNFIPCGKDLTFGDIQALRGIADGEIRYNFVKYMNLKCIGIGIENVAMGRFNSVMLLYNTIEFKAIDPMTNSLENFNVSPYGFLPMIEYWVLRENYYKYEDLRDGKTLLRIAITCIAYNFHKARRGYKTRIATLTNKGIDKLNLIEKEEYDMTKEKWCAKQISRIIAVLKNWPVFRDNYLHWYATAMVCANHIAARDLSRINGDRLVEELENIIINTNDKTDRKSVV